MSFVNRRHTYIYSNYKDLLCITSICSGFFHILFCVNVVVSTNGQDARFSQINNAPLMLNSALTGRTSGGIELGIMSSSQTTNSTSIAHQHVYLHTNSDYFKILEYKVDSAAVAASKKLKGYWGYGIHYYHYGDNQMGFTKSTTPLNGSFYSLSVAKHFYKKLQSGEQHFFGVGLGMAVANGQLKENAGLYNDSEISGGAFRYRPTFPNNAVSERQYVDWNMGAYYGYRGNSFYFETGAGLNHLFYPRSDIFDDEETKLRHRGTLYSVFGVPLSQKLMIIQKNVYWREGLYFRSFRTDSTYKNEIWTGIEIRHRIINQKKVYAEGGLYTRSLKTIMPYASVHIGPVVNLRLSYEWPVNRSKYFSYTANRFETTFVFSFGKPFFDRQPLSQNHLRW